ncbi:alpha/beta hydrolase fold domain-containing protein [Brachybacterium endophyticum]|nr:alpha/beta hydrolase fold domain-containing protein [Brachybacterium endophyticum]
MSSVHVETPAPHPGEEEASGADALRRATWITAHLPTGLFEFGVRRTHGNTKPDHATVERSLVTRSRHRGIPVTWIDRENANRGVLIHLHGGTYVKGEHPDHWDWLADMRRRGGMAVAMLHYRLPPEMPFPAAYDDAVEGVLGIVEDFAPYTPRWVLSGDSAGAGLALAVAQTLRDRDEQRPSALVLTAPWVDLTLNDPRIAEQEEKDPALSRETLARSAALYADGFDLEDPRLSPLFRDLRDLPPVHLTVGDQDILLGDALRLRDGLADAGTEVTWLEQPGGWHCYPMVWRGPVSQYARRRQIAFVREALRFDVPVNEGRRAAAH